MNYLAHAFFSPLESQVLLGNIACDMIRPADTEELPLQIVSGMNLHQEIDRYTDRHRGFISARDLLNRHKLPYAGVLTDIIFDHYLARDWNKYSNQTLSDFSEKIYGILRESNKAQWIPGFFPRLATALVTEDWFRSYATEDGLAKALDRLNYRSSRTIPVDRIMLSVRADYSGLQKGFNDLMNDLILNFPHAQ